MAVVACGLCGQLSDPDLDGDPPLTWTADTTVTADGPATSWVCTDCTRRHLRAIESKLERDWW